MALPEGAIIRHAVREGAPPSPSPARTSPLTAPDVSTILRLINELADYEKALSSVQATEATLLETLTFAPSITNSPHPDILPT
ncbi:hypothetical protein V498_07907, partial [Pseudogymnoascus sp. VKM F-4517 (FW-2822)]